MAPGPITLVPLGSEPSGVSGLHRYFGAIELRTAPDGLVVVDRLSLERYLLGLNEVPPDWPTEALRAQAVAARTYALWTLERPRGGAAATYGFDICASDQCQVFTGADILDYEGGARWTQAVHATRGEAVVYGGEPILARYHSTSGGATLANPQAFPGDPDLPYLRPVESTTEQASPLYRWSVRFSLKDLQAILEDAGWWGPADGVLRAVRTARSSAGLHYPDVRFIGRRASRRTVEELRVLLRAAAPAAFPGRYPSPAPTSSGRLPETLPSNRATISTTGGVVRIHGRGWGHGVGMSQWGAHGMAQNGSGYRDILRHYYRNTTVEDTAEPRSIEVGVAWALPRVSVLGAFRIVDGAGATVVRKAFGTWRFTPRDPGAVSVTPPPRFGAPLRITLLRAPKRVTTGEATSLTVDLSAPAQVTVVTSSGPRDAGDAAVVRDAGERRVPWVAPEGPGRYEVRVEASAGAGSPRTEAVQIEVIESRAAGPEGQTPADGRSGWATVALWLAGATFLALVALGAASFVGTMGR
ncbi:MAG: SpoIID/LytB domain-containing protein [Actinomycetota bacterium]